MPRVISRVFAYGVAAALTVCAVIVAAQPGGDRAVVGTLQRVEGQTLTLLTSHGTETVVLSPTATVHVGSRTLALSELASRTGSRIKVRYTESGGQKQAQSITVAAVKRAAQTT